MLNTKLTTQLFEILLPNNLISKLLVPIFACFLFASLNNMVIGQELPQFNECPSEKEPPILNAYDTWQLLLTPGFVAPESRYPANSDCHWVIKAETEDQRVILKVFSSVLEDRLFTECDDFVQINDGPNSSYPLLARWCGNNHPTEITSKSDSLYVRFKSDNLSSKRGANMSFAQFAIPGCPQDWTKQGAQCYKWHDRQMSWLDAQRQCVLDRANLIVFKDELHYSSVSDLFDDRLTITPRDELPWIGYEDSIQEGTIKPMNVSMGNNVWPDKFDELESTNTDVSDCLFITVSNTPYDIDDCRHLRYFICHRSIGDNTTIVVPNEQLIRAGYTKSTAVEWSILNLWPLFAVLILLMIIVCVACCFKKRPNQGSRNSIEPFVPKEQLPGTSTIRRSDEVGMNNINTVVKTSNHQNINAVHGLTNANVHKVEEEDEEPHFVQRLHTEDPERGVEQERSIDELQTTEASVASPRQNDHNITHVVQVQPAGSQHQNSRGLPRHNMITTTNLHHNGVGGGRGLARIERVSQMPPIDRFDRPNIHALDNVSAISMDEFWSKMDTRPRPKSSANTTTDARTQF